MQSLAGCLLDREFLEFRAETRVFFPKLFDFDLELDIEADGRLLGEMLDLLGESPDFGVIAVHGQQAGHKAADESGDNNP
jgi:hypothetical protein